ncbi:TetR/AcrR family transcriptional regulator [Terasakiella pusilla]|uniref:TetR/AcrR family transcriptional regulator n=1 Tax=Terasakiella pusilla TaxID=64973 RepID=UPI003AA85DBC
MARPKKTQSSLSKQIIVEHALSLLDESGPKAISFRSLAEQLGVTAMAIKHHVGSKEQLFQDLVSLAFKDIAIEPATTSANEPLLMIMGRYCQRVVKHTNLLNEILINPTLIDEQLSQLNSLIIEQLQKAGVKGEKQLVVLGVIVDYTHGFAFSMAAIKQRTSRPENSLSIADYVQGLELLVKGLIAQST